MEHEFKKTQPVKIHRRSSREMKYTYEQPILQCIEKNGGNVRIQMINIAKE